MALGKTKITAVVLKKDGSLHLALDSMSAEQAQRWADEGYVVFLIGVRDKEWAINHVNSGKVLTEASAIPNDSGDAEQQRQQVAALLPHMRGD